LTDTIITTSYTITEREREEK